MLSAFNAVEGKVKTTTVVNKKHSKGVTKMKKHLLKAIVVALALVFTFSLLTACDGDMTGDRLENEYGIVVDGGGFEKGAIIVSTEIDASSEEGKTVLEKIKTEEYNKDGNVYVYDISVKSDGVKVQPSGKVRVTIPVGDLDLSGYDVLHIKSDGTIERLSATFADGKVTFETDSFSLFVLVEKQTFEFLATCSPIEGGYITENNQTVEFDGARSVDVGTQITLTAVAGEDYSFEGWYYYNEVQEETLISADATHTFTINESLYAFAKFEERLTYVFLAQCETSDGGYITENGERVDFGNGRKVDPDTQITLTAVANDGYEFKGWGTRDDDWNLEIISTEATHTFTVTEGTYVQAVFAEKATGLRIDAHNAGFTYEDGVLTTTVYTIGDEFKPNIEQVLIYATFPTQSAECLTINDDYTRDLGGLDFEKAGTYTVTYTFNADTTLTVSLTVQVVAE